MVKTLNKVNEVATNGIKIHIRGKEIDLQEIEPKELEAMLDEVTDEEAEAINEEIIEQIGQDAMNEIIDELEGYNSQYSKEGCCEDYEEDCDRLDPIILDVPVGLTHDLNELDKGINNASYLSGRYTAFVNVGMSSKQAYDLVVMELRQKHEEAMFNKQADLQKEIKKQEMDLALQMNAFKQIISEE